MCPFISLSYLYSPAPFCLWDSAGRTLESDLTSFLESQLPQLARWRASKWAVQSGKSYIAQNRINSRGLRDLAEPEPHSVTGPGGTGRGGGAAALDVDFTTSAQGCLTSVMPTALAICQRKGGRKEGGREGRREGEGGRKKGKEGGREGGREKRKDRGERGEREKFWGPKNMLIMETVLSPGMWHYLIFAKLQMQNSACP